MNLATMLRIPASRAQPSDAERAFAALSRRLGLSRSGVETVRELAATSDVPPVALLISEHAFLVALAEAERAATLDRAPMTDAMRRAVASVRHELFAEP
ncbi:MAG: hypothetical protein R3B46_12845 [Phycisphaerales bacterium]